jgi:hypothetical protein|tara:strand:- start:2939 stop:4639 length:1701 start_codon:yes stop_codon:yes gene_type:complete
MANGVKIFGFEIKKSAEVKRETEPLKDASVVPPTDDDGAGYVTSGANHYGMAMDIYGDLTVKDQHDLIRKYRIAAQQPEVDMAIEEIVNEAIVVPQTNDIVVDIDLDLVDISPSIKKKVTEEFEHLLNIMDFDARCHDMFRCWYVDGRLYHHLVVDKDNLKAGIQEIRYIDSLKIRKVRHIKKNTNKEGVTLVADVEEFYIFNDTIVGSGQGGANGFSSAAYGSGKNSGVKLSNDSVSYVTSGLLDDTRTKVVSNLQKSLRVINQLRMMEDSLIIYRMARAPERRIFYVDTGNLPKAKAEEYLNSLMTRYRNKLVYDGNTGELKDSRKHMTMLDDFWLPRREGGRGTEVSTLPGGSNLGEIDDIKYFQRKVYQSLNVPVSRLEQEQAYSIGRATEITREEIKFQKFITRLRMRFSKLFTGILKQQLILKGIITEVDWHDKFSNRIRIDYYKDNHYTELKDAEVMRERLGLMDQAVQYVGEYLSKDWVMTNIMQLDNEEKVAMNVQMKKEIASGEIDTDGDDGEAAEDNTSAAPQAPKVNPIKPSKEKEKQDVDAERIANAPEERQG